MAEHNGHDKFPIMFLMLLGYESWGRTISALQVALHCMENLFEIRRGKKLSRGWLFLDF